MVFLKNTGWLVFLIFLVENHNSFWILNLKNWIIHQLSAKGLECFSIKMLTGCEQKRSTETAPKKCGCCEKTTTQNPTFLAEASTTEINTKQMESLNYEEELTHPSKTSTPCSCCDPDPIHNTFSGRGSLIILIVGVRCPRPQRQLRSGKKGVGSVKTSGVPIFSQAGDLPFTCRAEPDLHPATLLTVNCAVTSRLTMTFQSCGAQVPACLIYSISH